MSERDRLMAELNSGLVSDKAAKANGRPSSDRYAGRILNVASMLAEPEQPIPWRCEGLAADGFLTTITGRGGEGKSWLALTLACGVARGATAAGISCTKGKALLYDAENGPKLTIRRFRAAGVGADLHVQPVDAGGLRITTDLAWFRKVIEEQRADLVIFDSLRVLSSGVKENDSDALEPLITALKQLARETGAAIILIHHRGKAEGSDYRGTSVILDQTDLLFTLGRVPGDPEGRHRRKLATVKCRIDEEPQPRWVAIQADRARGLVYVNEAEPYEEEEDRPRDGHREKALDVLGGIAQSGRQIAKKLDLSEATTRRLLHDLQADGLAEKTPDGWVRHRVTPYRRDARDAPPSEPLKFGSVEPFPGASQGASRANGSDAPLSDPACSCVDGGVGDDPQCERCFGWRS
jgi:hypothetical protein